MLLRYCRERLDLTRMLPAAVLIACAARVAPATSVAPATGVAPASVPVEHAFALDVGFALLLVVIFRMWDDLADRPLDAHRHPDRVLVQARSTAPVSMAAALLAVGAVTIVVARDGFGSSLGILVALSVGLAVWYRTRGPRTALGDHVLLAKYPAFAMVVGGGFPATDSPAGWLSLAVLYMAFCVYEVWHDREAPGGRRRLAAESALLAGAIVALAFSIGGSA